MNRDVVLGFHSWTLRFFGGSRASRRHGYDEEGDRFWSL